MSKRTQIDSDRFFGIDGEGVGRAPHLYVMLCASDNQGNNQRVLKNPLGLTTRQCLDFMLSLPQGKYFAFSFMYDLTKILQDLPNSALYHLFREELRQPVGDSFLPPKPVKWFPPGERLPYRINMIGRAKFMVKRGNQSFAVWDIFRFYQAKFMNALRDWKVGDKATLENMSRMKDSRSGFELSDLDAMQKYCLDECIYMGSLAHKLREAHEKAGLKLKSYFGAGSSASAALDLMGIRDLKRDGPVEMARPVASAFFGGRFENSVFGGSDGPVWGYDISSAYPYELRFLPCLECGTWQRTRSRARAFAARAALVRWRLRRLPEDEPWAPFPYRLPTGSIIFPGESAGGWVWGSEFFEGQKAFPDYVEFREAWVYECDCHHVPFERIPEWYVERVRIGKEGPGIVLKLAMNSCYGKLAQSVGKAPPFQSWIWAGMITSGTRGQLLKVLGMHKDRRNMLMTATDGVYTRERIETPKPRNTGTLQTGKPLGGWEEKPVPQGMFLVRPGVYFPMNPTEEELEKVRARGIGRANMFKHWKSVLEAYERGEMSASFPSVQRFVGAKTGIHRVALKLKGPWDSEHRERKGAALLSWPQAWEYRRSEKYGEWVERPIECSFNPLPKREYIREDGTLAIRFPGEGKFSAEKYSTPYNRSLKSPEGHELADLTEELLEQPDGADYSLFEDFGAMVNSDD